VTRSVSPRRHHRCLNVLFRICSRSLFLIILTLMTTLCFTNFSNAQEIAIHLKSAQTLFVDTIEETDDKVFASTNGIPLTFDRNEIEWIDYQSVPADPSPEINSEEPFRPEAFPFRNNKFLPNNQPRVMPGEPNLSSEPNTLADSIPPEILSNLKSNDTLDYYSGWIDSTLSGTFKNHSFTMTDAILDGQKNLIFRTGPSDSEGFLQITLQKIISGAETIEKRSIEFPPFADSDWIEPSDNGWPTPITTSPRIEIRAKEFPTPIIIDKGHQLWVETENISNGTIKGFITLSIPQYNLEMAGPFEVRIE
jgi:hypothetical protein